MLSHTGRSLGQMMSRSSGSISRVRMNWLVLVLMHAGMSLNIVHKAFLQLRSREEAWRGEFNLSQLFMFIMYNNPVSACN